uniref:Pentapeptide repeat-containing protein n=1 Tax=Rhodosorus marinus TaxID=101924 RepID=A0A7S0G8P3_9RHOD|mmetsp:Transcript_8922/g.13022  ORF Transcript_8922/g.13022 Transcript_8922/m.13022 type:complete len:189 (+) Transcript_8922:128-694(+)
MSSCFIGNAICGHKSPPHQSKICGRSLGQFGAAVVIAGSVLAAPVIAGEVLNYDHNQSLGGADFTDRQDLVGAIFTKANCQSAIFKNANLTNANVEDANFTDADFTSAKLTNAFAPKVKFTRAKLINTDLQGANLIGVKFDGADITGADFSDALLDPATVIRLCKKAKGINPMTEVSTAESLMCPDAE